MILEYFRRATDQECIQIQYMATDADVREAKHQYKNERNKDHKAKVEQIMKIIDDQLTEEDIHCLAVKVLYT